jgi:glycosidase
MYLSLVRGDAGPLTESLRDRPVPPKDAHWATFVRNHDELTLDKLTEAQRKEIFDALGPRKDMQLYGRGLRRRLPTLVDGDQRRMRLVYSLLFALPGTPTLFYGEEIGMGENLAIEGRLAVRTPMQWTSQSNGGFSRARPSRLRRPLVEGAFGPEHVNVADQRNDPDSLFAFIALLIKTYRESPELGWSPFRVLDQPHRQVLAQECVHDDRRLVTVHNLGSASCVVPLELEGCDSTYQLVDLLTDEVHTTLDDRGRTEVPLDGYGYRWLRVRQPDTKRLI